ncbi:MAG: hypothetical protein ACI95S_002572, partial [Dinoroseobacter sp.]
MCLNLLKTLYFAVTNAAVQKMFTMPQERACGFCVVDLDVSSPDGQRCSEVHWTGRMVMKGSSYR